MAFEDNERLPASEMLPGNSVHREPSVVLSPEAQMEDQSEIDRLAQELTGIRARNDERRSYLSQLAMHINQDSSQEKAEVLRDERIGTKIEELLSEKLEIVKPDNYIAQTGQALQKGRQYVEVLSQEEEILLTDLRTISHEITQINKTLEELKQSRRIKRLTAFSQRREMERRLNELYEQQQKTKEQRRAKEKAKLGLLDGIKINRCVE